MMTVEGRELLKEQLIRRHALLPVPWILPITLIDYCSWGFSLSLGSSSISALALLRCLRAPCHLVGLSLLSLLVPFAMALSLSNPPAQPNSTGQLTRPTHPNSTQLAWPNSLGPTHPTQLAWSNSLGLTHSTQLIRSTQLTWSHSVNPARSTCHVTNSLAGQPTNHLPSGINVLLEPSSLPYLCPPIFWDHVLLESSCISLQSTHLNDFVVTGGGVM